VQPPTVAGHAEAAREVAEVVVVLVVARGVAAHVDPSESSKGLKPTVFHFIDQALQTMDGSTGLILNMYSPPPRRACRARTRRWAARRAVALQVAFERQTLKPVLHLIGYRLWV
jgi:hypothetical protein